MSLPTLRECFGLDDPDRCAQLAFVTGFSLQRLRDFAEGTEASYAEFVGLLAGYVIVTEEEEQDPFLRKLEGIVYGRLPREVVLGATARLFELAKQELREEGEDV